VRPGPTAARDAELERREQELLGRHRAAWLGAQAPGLTWRFRRGLLGLEVGAADLDALDAASRSPAWPWLEAMSVHGPLTVSAQQLATANLAGVTELDLGVRPLRYREGIGDVGAAAITRLDLPYLARLDLRGNNLGESAARALGRWRSLGRMRSLRLGRNPLGDGGAAALASSPHLARLARLDLARCGLGAVGVRALAMSSLASLTDLDLSGNTLGNPAVEHLADSKHISGLTSLRLVDAQVGAGGAQALAGSRNAEHLTLLDLTGNDIGDAGARALAASPYLKNLRVLRLGGNGIGRAGAVALADSRPLRLLRELSLEGNVLDGRSAGPLRLVFGDGVFFTARHSAEDG
jgi:hypothetical protein